MQPTPVSVQPVSAPVVLTPAQLAQVSGAGPMIPNGNW